MHGKGVIFAFNYIGTEVEDDMDVTKSVATKDDVVATHSFEDVSVKVKFQKDKDDGWLFIDWTSIFRP